MVEVVASVSPLRCRALSCLDTEKATRWTREVLRVVPGAPRLRWGDTVTHVFDGSPGPGRWSLLRVSALSLGEESRRVRLQGSPTVRSTLLVRVVPGLDTGPLTRVVRQGVVGGPTRTTLPCSEKPSPGSPPIIVSTKPYPSCRTQSGRR